MLLYNQLLQTLTSLSQALSIWFVSYALVAPDLMYVARDKVKFVLRNVWCNASVGMFTTYYEFDFLLFCPIKSVWDWDKKNDKPFYQLLLSRVGSRHAACWWLNPWYVGSRKGEADMRRSEWDAVTDVNVHRITPPPVYMSVLGGLFQEEQWCQCYVPWVGTAPKHFTQREKNTQRA